MGNRILFLTGSYPFYPGEQFIEDEIPYWAAQKTADVCIAPAAAHGVPRNLPTSIGVDLTLASGSKLQKLIFIFFGLWSPIFRKEISYILSKHGCCLRCFVVAIRATGSTLYYEEKLKNLIKTMGGVDTVYCYWSDAQAYAAILLKKNGLVKNVFARAHGYDLYEDRRPYSYMPLKRQFIKQFDCILAISNQGKEYLSTTYGANSKNIFVSRLGVPVNEFYTKHTAANKLNILSTSFCVPIKRIDKIIDALALCKSKVEDIDIYWTHIGGGPLFETLSALAKEKLAAKGVRFNFTGMMKNTEVKKYFELNEVDLFVNASESEGVPVSIMEAMSYGVPTIAPNVGGISEIVSNRDGCLMSVVPDSQEISDAILEMRIKCKDNEFRKKVKNKIIKQYDAKKNYVELVNMIASC